MDNKITLSLGDLHYLATKVSKGSIKSITDHFYSGLVTTTSIMSKEETNYYHEKIIVPYNVFKSWKDCAEETVSFVVYNEGTLIYRNNKLESVTVLDIDFIKETI